MQRRTLSMGYKTWSFWASADLTGITASTALGEPYRNLTQSQARKGTPRLFAHGQHRRSRSSHDAPKPEKTLYNVISKSGGTAETIAQLMIIVDVLERNSAPGRLRTTGRDHQPPG